MADPEPTAEMSSLLTAPPEEQRQRVLELPAEAAAPMIDALGRERTTAAASLLAIVEDAARDAATRKAARRQLHRLRSIGIVPEPREAPASQPSAPRERSVEPDGAWTTSYDPGGSRALWVVGERSLGGIWVAGLVLNDRQGLRDLELFESTRKRFRRDLDEWRRDPYSTWVELPADYAMRLAREGVDQARDAGAALPTNYPRFRDLFGEADAAPERPIAFETVSPVEATFNPDWLEASAELVHEREVAIWRLEPPDELRERALDVARGKSAPILVPGSDPATRAWQLVVQSAEKLLTPDVQQGLRRRLEETAYVFLQTDRLTAARFAVAASQALSDRNTPLARQPVPLELALNGFLWALRAETIDGESAGEVFYEMAVDGRDAAEETGATPTTASGLILPGR